MLRSESCTTSLYSMHGLSSYLWSLFWQVASLYTSNVLPTGGVPPSVPQPTPSFCIAVLLSQLGDCPLPKGPMGYMMRNLEIQKQIETCLAAIAAASDTKPQTQQLCEVAGEVFCRSVTLYL